MPDQTVSFVAVPSGDHESFCWDVTADEYRRLYGAEPVQPSHFHPDLYVLYEGWPLPSIYPSEHVPVRVTITVRLEGTRRTCTVVTEEIDPCPSPSP